jgi:hypothetical protein
VVPAQIFPTLRAQNLEGVEVELPAAFAGERNVVVIAFRREHQALVDSWVPWFERRAATDPGLRFYEIPTIGRMWAPVRRFIDGGMAAAIRDPVVLRRTLTVYGNVDRVTVPLGIDDRSTITVLGVDRAGRVRWSGRGGFTEAAAAALEAAFTADQGG